MADFISREEAISFARSSAGAAYNRDDFYAYRALNDFIVTLISIPAADVVEVVRCKDCKNHEQCSVEFEFANYDPDNAFCWEGKRNG